MESHWQSQLNSRLRTLPTQQRSLQSHPNTGRAWALHPPVNILMAYRVSWAHSDFHCRDRLASCVEQMKAASEWCCCSGTHKQNSIFLYCPKCFSFIQYQRLCLLDGNKWWSHFDIRVLLGIWESWYLYLLIWGPIFFPLILIDCSVLDSLIRFESIYSLCFHPLSTFYVE